MDVNKQWDAFSSEFGFSQPFIQTTTSDFYFHRYAEKESDSLLSLC